MRRHTKALLFGGGAFAAILIAVLAMSDHNQIAGRFYDNPKEAQKLDRIDDAGYALGAQSGERDWTVASFLSPARAQAVDHDANKIFTLAAYGIYVGGGIGSLVFAGITMLGLGASRCRGLLSWLAGSKEAVRPPSLPLPTPSTPVSEVEAMTQLMSLRSSVSPLPDSLRSSRRLRSTQVSSYRSARPSAHSGRPKSLLSALTVSTQPPTSLPPSPKHHATVSSQQFSNRSLQT